MKRTIAIFALLAFIPAMAQTAADYKARYERQVKMLGPDGVGVETIIDNWESVAPEDGEMLVARHNFWLAKCMSRKVVVKNQPRWLGEKPVLVLKDSLGADVNYFQESFYDDEMFGNSISAIDKAISLYPDELPYRYVKINAFLGYEKESPDMALSEIMALVDSDAAAHPGWKYNGEPADRDIFLDGVQEYCHAFFKIGSEGGYEAFRVLSERMAKLCPKNAVFQSNLGSYWLVAKQNEKKALTFYKKALKLDPDDYAAKRNMEIIESGRLRRDQPSK